MITGLDRLPSDQSTKKDDDINNESGDDAHVNNDSSFDGGHSNELRCIFPGNRVPRNWREVLFFSKNTGIPRIFPFFVPGSRVPLFPLIVYIYSPVSECSPVTKHVPATMMLHNFLWIDSKLFYD